MASNNTNDTEKPAGSKLNQLKGFYPTSASNWVKLKLHLLPSVSPSPATARNNLKVIRNNGVMGLLKQLSKNLIIQDVIRGTIPERKPGEIHWRVLILDHFSSKIVSSCCGMHDITAEGVTLVEDLLKKREPLQFLEAIYVLNPTDRQSVAKLMEDLEAFTPLYKAFHIFFLELCPMDLLEKVGAVRNLSRIKSFKEITLSFIPYQSHVFTMEKDLNTNRFYYNMASNLESVRDNIDRIAGQISSLCACLGEMPSIRYRSAFPKNGELAHVVNQKLQEYKKADQTLGEGSEKAKSQLIILDRGFDCTTPILHELSFEAMIHDLLPIGGGAYTFKGSDGKEKKMFLDEEEEFWLSLKHMHIGEVIMKVPQEYKKFMESKNLDYPASKGDQMSMKDLQLMIRKMPQYQKELTLFSTFINIAGDCMEQFKRIGKLCSVEQDLAAGTDSQGERIRDFMPQMNPILLDLDKLTGFSDLEKLRIIMLYIIHKNGISEDSLAKLLSHANVDPSLRNSIDNLVLLGSKVVVSNGAKSDIHPQFERKRRNDDDDRLPQSRWTPIVKDVVEFAMEDKLDKNQFPYQSNRGGESGYKVATSTRYGNWYPKTGNAGRTVPRLIVFIVGGVTFSEIRSIYEINKSQTDWEVLIGSTEILTPNDFIKGLENLS